MSRCHTPALPNVEVKDQDLGQSASKSQPEVNSK